MPPTPLMWSGVGAILLCAFALTTASIARRQYCCRKDKAGRRRGAQRLPTWEEHDRTAPEAESVQTETVDPTTIGTCEVPRRAKRSTRDKHAKHEKPETEKLEIEKQREVEKGEKRKKKETNEKLVKGEEDEKLPKGKKGKMGEKGGKRENRKKLKDKQPPEVGPEDLPAPKSQDFRIRV